jgi:hypothetical protein
MGAAAPGPFIYVWPSRELISRSWSWPSSWHDAFQDAASRVGLAVAIYALDGGLFSRRLISLQLSIGAIKFRVRRRGNSLHIAVVAFTGPDHSPDSPDGTRQPSAVEGLILGLHGSGENSYLVVFHGQIPFIPAGVYRREHSRQMPAFAGEQGNMAGNNKIVMGNQIGSLLRAGSSGDMDVPKSCCHAAGSAKDGRRTTAPKPGVTNSPAPRCNWTKATTLASPEMKNGCLGHPGLARPGLARANSQPILIVLNAGRGRKLSLVCRFLDEKHPFSHVLSKRLH